MYCPSCKKRELKPTKLDVGLPAYGCANCHGVLIDLLAYRVWTESHAPTAQHKTVTPQATEDTKRAFACPKCSKLMTKYRIADEVENKVDLCSYCGEIWLDGGEWELLVDLDLQRSIPQILSEPWQKGIRKRHAAQSVEEKFEALLGAADYEKVNAFRAWMFAHEHAPEIQDFLHRTPTTIS